MESVKNNKTFTRLKVSNRTIDGLAVILKQCEDEFTGMWKFKKDDVCDIILSLRNYALSDKELNEIRKQKFTPLQRAKWLLKQVEKNSAEGGEVDINSLMKQIKVSHKAKKKTSKVSKSPSKEGGSTPSDV